MNESDNALDLDLARSVAPYFRVTNARANEIIANFKTVIAGWPDVATACGIGRAEQRNMAPAFM